MTDRSEKAERNRHLYGWDDRWVAKALEAGTFDVRDDIGITPLWHAVYFGQDAWVARLLAAGARVDAHDAAKIDRASGSGHTVTLWYGTIPDGECPTGPSTLLHVGASSRGTARTLTHLLTHGLVVDARDRYGDTPLHVACFSNNVEAMELLISAGADVDALDRHRKTPLDHCNGGVERVNVLLAAGAKPNARRELDTWNPEALAASIAAGTDVRQFPKSLEQAVRGGQAESVRILLEAGAVLEGQDGMSAPIVIAAMSADRECVDLLLPHYPGELDNALAGALSCRYYDSDKAEAIAKRKDLVAWLVGKGADPTAALLASVDIADYAFLLVELGARLDATTDSGENLLVLAARAGHRALAELLLKRGLDPKSRAADGASAYEVAERTYKQGKVDDARFVMSAIAAAGGKPAPPPASKLLTGPRIGARVRHAKFGGGTIAGIAGDKWTIDFDSGESKTLMSKFLTLA